MDVKRYYRGDIARGEHPANVTIFVSDKDYESLEAQSKKQSEHIAALTVERDRVRGMAEAQGAVDAFSLWYLTLGHMNPTWYEEIRCMVPANILNKLAAAYKSTQPAATPLFDPKRIKTDERIPMDCIGVVEGDRIRLMRQLGEGMSEAGYIPLQPAATPADWETKLPGYHEGCNYLANEAGYCNKCGCFLHPTQAPAAETGKREL